MRLRCTELLLGTVLSACFFLRGALYVCFIFTIVPKLAIFQLLRLLPLPLEYCDYRQGAMTYGCILSVCLYFGVSATLTLVAHMFSLTFN